MSTQFYFQGNDIRLMHVPETRDFSAEKQTFSVRIHEDSWMRADRLLVNREHLLMALADVDFILIRATDSKGTKEAGISSVTLSNIASRDEGLGFTTAVEECSCPVGYKGLSCEDCAPGYTRSSDGLYLGLCQPCQCYGHSAICHAETGVCLVIIPTMNRG